MPTRSYSALAAVSLSLVLFSAQLTHAQDLSFFKNYFVTGSYEVAGVGVSGTGVDGIATGTLNFNVGNANEVPAEAEILGAFLYWQIVSKESLGPDSGIAGASFNGYPLSTSYGPLAKVLDQAGTAPCWSSGGGTGTSGGSHKTYTYRADVLRFLPVGDQENVQNFGKHLLNDDDLAAHGKPPLTIELPDSGSGNGVPNALGASLVVIYRDPDPTASLSAIVMYDGGHTMNNDTDMMTQTIEGFYDPSPTPLTLPKITHIVGSGQFNKSERLLVPGTPPLFNEFDASEGPQWDNVTIDELAIPTLPYVTTSVDHEGFSSFDCLTWGAVIYQTEVQDSDHDGLLDIWESSENDLQDPNGVVLPNLAAMGADPYQQDLFIEISYLFTDENATYGSGTDASVKGPHTHLPTPEALRLVGESFADKGIRAHFDVGSTYGSTYPSWEAVAGPYVVPAAYARGGDSMDEQDTVESCELDPDAPWVCQFSEHPGTVGWKSGFRFFRDRPLTLTDDECELAESDGNPSTTCERVFDRNRKDIFRYALFAHALGVPKAACLVEDEASLDFGYPDEACMATNPDYHVPATFTGVGDYLGGDLMVTLGAFDDFNGNPVGTDFWQASTLMHELGHNLGRRHGGDPFEPNCKPNYLSVMNYLFQLRGLFDVTGMPRVDFSSDMFPMLDENDLDESAGLGVDAPYRTAWYAPVAPGSLGDILGIPVAMSHCDGSPLLDTDVDMVRIDGTGRTIDPIDWNADGDSSDSSLAQDLNLDGSPTVEQPAEPLNGSNDWDNLRLNQGASRRNVGGWFFVQNPETGEFVAFMGPMSLDSGRGDLGRGDLGRGDLGRGDLGRGDLGRGDLGRGDLGRGDLGQSDLGRGDLGRGDLGRGDLGRGDLGRGDLGRGDLGVAADDGVFEIDRGTATALGNSPPYLLTAARVDDTTELAWKAPNVGSVTQYLVFRVEGATITPASSPVAVGTVSAGPGLVDYEFTDNTDLASGDYTYWVVAEFADGATSGPSNFVTVTVVSMAYGLEPVKNLPPPGGKKFRAGSSVPLQWKFTMDGLVVDSSDTDPMITIRRAEDPLMVFTFTAEDPGNSSFRLPSSPSWTWHFNWQTVDETGAKLPKKTYIVDITIQKTGQTFTDVAEITLK